jgi:transcriptional regulator with XRE-family HTH domain
MDHIDAICAIYRSLMSKKLNKAISNHGLSAIELLGSMIRIARKERKLTVLELADRAGISRGLIQRIEQGDPSCSIGAVFEVAVIVGVPLFEVDSKQLSQKLNQTNEKLALLPKTIHKSRQKVNDDF